MKNICLGVIFSSRDFFPAHLVTQARKDVLEVLAELGISSVMLCGRCGRSRRCAELSALTHVWGPFQEPPG